MPTIKIDDLHPTGAELFSDSESYMNELGESELDLVMGGRTTPVCRAISKSVVEASKAVSRASRAVKNDPKKAASKVSRFVGSGVAWEISIELSKLSNPF
jgi:hypothetical protein